ncbi:MAG: SWIM zinc finger family protein, partial [Chitinophagales bacterium]
MMNSTPNNPIITRYLHNNTLSSSRTQGRKIFKKGNYKLKRFDASKEKVIYEVQNDAKSHNYTVTINDYANTSSPIKAHCTCLYSLGGICKHRVAVLLALDQILFEQEDDTQSTLYNQSNTVVYMENIDESIIRAAASKQDWIIAQQLAENNRATIITDETQTATANLPTAEQSYKVIIQKEGEEKFITSCGCKENRFKLCMHKVAIFLQIKMQQGIWAFDLMKNWDEFKNNLLHPYGFSLNDDLSGKFTFKMGERTPELVLLDESIVPLADLETWGAKYRPKTPEQRTINVDEIMPRAIINKKNAANKFVLAYAFQFWGEESQLPGFAFTPIVGKLSTEENKIISHVAPLLNTYGNIETKNLPEINPKDLQLLQLSKEMSWSSVGEVARTNFANKAKHTYKGTGGYYVYAESLQDNELQIIQQYVLQKLKRAFVALKNKRIFHLKNSGKKISINNLVPLTLSMDKVKLHFSVHEIDDFVELSAKLKIRDQFLEIKDAQLISSFMLLNNNTLYLLDLDEDPQILRLFTKTPVIKVRVQEVGALIKNLIIPLQSKYTVDTYISIDIAQRYITPKAELYLKEDEDYLVFQPILNYKGWQVELDGVEEIVFEEDGSIIKIVRDRFYEEDFLRFLLQQHPYFEEQYAENNGLFFYLPYDEIMEQMWFLNFFDALRENYIELFGFKSLHHFRYNINKPEVEFRVSSGIDWFDIEAEIQFGNQTVSLKEVQKALLRNERFVKLGDGTLGVLPENWLKKYATLFKMGSLQGNNKLQVSKVHFSLVDELYE